MKYYRVTILCNKFDGHPKGFAYIEFGDKDSVQTAMAMDESLFRGRQIKVSSSDYKGDLKVMLFLICSDGFCELTNRLLNKQPLSQRFDCCRLSIMSSIFLSLHE